MTTPVAMTTRIAAETRHHPRSPARAKPTSEAATREAGVAMRTMRPTHSAPSGDAGEEVADDRVGVEAVGRHVERRDRRPP